MLYIFTVMISIHDLCTVSIVKLFQQLQKNKIKKMAEYGLDIKSRTALSLIYTGEKVSRMKLYSNLQTSISNPKIS